ncbi:DUF4307 domain-containing protein [Micrococcus porci]|uniref:DUF4307 domain-containing protein n=1 Tax=Micrococcus porci TaxID=2856555 RepID=UPI003CF72BB7
MSSTPAPAASAPETTLATRYGVGQRRDRRRLRAVLGAVALVLAVAAAVAVALGNSVGRVEAKDVGYRIDDAAHAAVTFQVTLPRGVEAAACDLKVMDAQYAPVGFHTVRVSAGPDHPAGETVTYTADVRTVGRGVTGVVEGCRPA